MEEKEIIRVLYARKAVGWDEIRQCLNINQKHASPTRVVEQREMSESEYTEFINNTMKSRDWLNDKGGTINDVRQVIAVRCAGHPTLYVDPSGYDYARYIGLKINSITKEK